jgi:sulfur carrier protein
MPLTLVINGETKHFDALEPGSNLNLLLDALGLKADRIALELNGQIAPRTSWSRILLANTDKIELVHFVGGGCVS